MAKGATRVNGKNNESMWVTDEDLCFRVGSKARKIPLSSLAALSLENVEEARKLVTETELVPYGSWTENMPSSNGKTLYVVARDDESLWVMEINKSQLPTAQDFVHDIAPQSEEDAKREKIVAGRVIDTPLGAVFTILSIVCVIAAIFLVFSLEQPLIGLIVAIAGLVMHFLIK